MLIAYVPRLIRRPNFQELRQLEQRVLEGQEALRSEATRREAQLSELSEAAQRLAQTALRRAQAAAERSGEGQRLQRLEAELASFVRGEKEKQKRWGKI